MQLNEKQLSKQIELSVEKAINALDSIVTDDSRYLVFQWTASVGKLEIGLANYDNKHEFSLVQEDSYSELAFAFGSANAQEIEELLRFWLTDYLSSCGGFFRYALIALFHTGDASKSRLL